MPAFGAAAGATYAVVTSLLLLRRLGGWRAVRLARRGENPTLRWDELYPVEKTWFFGVVAFGVAAVAFAVLGTALVLSGNGQP